MNATNISYDSEVASAYNDARKTEEHWLKENEFIIQYFHEKNVKEILDVPVGTGRFIQFYPSEAKILGIDVSTHMIEQAKKETNQLNRVDVELQIGDAANLSFISDRTIDVIVCCRLLHLVENNDRIRFLKEFSRVLRGELVLQLYLNLPKRNIVMRGISKLVRELNSLFNKPAANITPWSHIRSYSLTETELREMLNETGLEVVERSQLCTYYGSAVVMLVLRNEK